MSELKVILLLNKWETGGQQGIGRQGSAQWQRQRPGRVAAGWVGAWQLTRHDNSSNWKMSDAAVGQTSLCRLRASSGNSHASSAASSHNGTATVARGRVPRMRLGRSDVSARLSGPCGRDLSPTWSRRKTSHSRPPPSEEKITTILGGFQFQPMLLPFEARST